MDSSYSLLKDRLEYHDYLLPFSADSISLIETLLNDVFYYKHKHEDLISSNKELSFEIERPKNSAEIERLQRNIRDLSELVNSLRSSLKEQEDLRSVNDLSVAKRLSSDKLFLSEEICKLKTELSSEKETHKEKDKIILSLRNNVSFLESQLNAAVNKARNYKSIGITTDLLGQTESSYPHDTALVENPEPVSELDSLRNTLISYQKSSEHLGLIESNQKYLERDLNSLLDSNKQLREEIKQLHREKEELETSKRNFESLYNRSKNDLNVMTIMRQSQIEQMKSVSSSYLYTNPLKEQDAHSYKTRITDLEGKWGKSYTSIKDTQNSQAIYQNMLNEKEQEVLELKNQIQETETKLRLVSEEKDLATENAKSIVLENEKLKHENQNLSYLNKILEDQANTNSLQIETMNNEHLNLNSLMEQQKNHYLDIIQEIKQNHQKALFSKKNAQEKYLTVETKVIEKNKEILKLREDCLKLEKEIILVREERDSIIDDPQRFHKDYTLNYRNEAQAKQREDQKRILELETELENILQRYNDLNRKYQEAQETILEKEKELEILKNAGSKNIQTSYDFLKPDERTDTNIKPYPAFRTLYEKEIESLKSQLEKLYSTHKSTNSLINDLNAQINSKDEHIQYIEKQLERNEKYKEENTSYITNLERELASLRQNKHSLQIQRSLEDELKNSQQTLKALEHQNEILETRVKLLTKELDEKSQKLNHLSNSNEELRREMCILKAELNTIQMIRSELNHKLERRYQESQEHFGLISSLKEDISKFKQGAIESQHKITSSEYEKEDLVQQIKLKNKQREKLELEKSDLVDKMNSYTQENKSLTHQNHSLNQSARFFNKQIAQKDSEIDKLGHVVNSLTKNLEIYKISSENNHKLNVQLDNTIWKLKKEKEIMRESMNPLKEEILERENKDLKEKLRYSEDKQNRIDTFLEIIQEKEIKIQEQTQELEELKSMVHREKNPFDDSSLVVEVINEREESEELIDDIENKPAESESNSKEDLDI